MSFAIAISAVLDTCADHAASIRTALVIGPSDWKTTLNVGYGMRCMGFADPAAFNAALFAPVPAFPVDAVRHKGGASVWGALSHALDLLVADITVCAGDALAALPVDFTSLSAVAVFASDGLDDLDRLSETDAALFERGFLRVTPLWIAAENRTIFLYLRSSLIPDIRRLDTRRRHQVSLAGLARLGRYANQCLQFIGMTLYGARSNATVLLPEWTGNIVFDIPPTHEGTAGPQVVSRSFSYDDLLLWDRDGKPVVNVDFEAFFQAFPRSYTLHKAFIRRILRFHDRIGQRIHNWFDENIPADSHLVTIHVRRGDYLLFQKDAPGLTVTPVDWYRSFLERIWPGLSNPKLVVATDEPLMLQFFQDYQPLDISASCAHLVGGAFIGDFIALQRADIALICNSSFSRTAVLLAHNDRQMVFKPGWAFGGFVAVDPWEDRLFWDWFAPLDLPEPGLLIDRAKVAAARGDNGRALMWLEAALAIDPANLSVRQVVRQMKGR